MMVVVQSEIRFTDVLTMASTVASYLGEADVLPTHLLAAIDILAGRAQLEELGRPRSPLAPLGPSRFGGAAPGVRALAQRWFASLGSDALSTLDAGQLETLRSEAEALGES